MVSVTPVAGLGEAVLLRLAATLERGSEHPLAAAIVAGASERGVRLADAEAFESLTGKGVRGRVDGSTVLLGNRRLMDDLGVATGDAAARADDLRRGGQTVMFRRGRRNARRPGGGRGSDQGQHP